MARIRTIKPEFCTSYDTAKLSRDARLFFLQLLTEVDDKGRVVASGKRLAGSLYPHDDDVTPVDIDRWVGEAMRVGMLHKYTSGNGTYLHVAHFEKHQRVSHPSPSRLPRCSCEPPEDDGSGSGETPEALAPEVEVEVDLGSGSRSREGECEGEPPPAKRARKRATPLPADFAITSDMRTWARAETPRVDIVRETRQFIDHAHANGKTQKDWTATWRTWMRKADSWLPAATGTAPAVPDSTTIPTCPDCGVGPTRTCARRRADCTWATPTNIRSNGNNGGELRVLRAAP